MNEQYITSGGAVVPRALYGLLKTEVGPLSATYLCELIVLLRDHPRVCQEVAEATRPMSNDYIKGCREGWMRAATFYVDMNAEGNADIIRAMNQRWPFK